ncbi:MAG: hypothetical protein HGB37_01380 [Candidatus Moranbacteria bacterium]|nr:hypothetical protein [Candidatus Moranbacteria bacterium]
MKALRIIIVTSFFALVSLPGYVFAENETQSSGAIHAKNENELSAGFYYFIGDLAGWNIGEDGKSASEQCHESGSVRGEETETGTGEPNEVSGKIEKPVSEIPSGVPEQEVQKRTIPVPFKPATVVRHVISAPYPNSYKKVNGRLVCAKKNDHPEKSKKNKKKHMDMECCLDPDEIPNPHCYYPPEKYGKYL